MIDDESLVDYLTRAGIDAIPEHAMVVEGKGFCSFEDDGERLIAHHCYGDGMYWLEVLKAQAEKRGYSEIVFFTKRNPAVWERRYGAKHIGHMMSLEVNHG